MRGFKYSFANNSHMSEGRLWNRLMQKYCYDGSTGGVSWLGDLMRGAAAFSSVGEPELLSLNSHHTATADFET